MPVHYHEGKFPPANLDWQKLIPLLGPASGALARYDGILAAIPNPEVLLSPLSTQEAVLSSRIEGTQATMGEVLEFQAGQAPVSEERREDIYEILNYRAAMRRAEELLKTLPFSLRVIREAHKVLLDGVRGQNKSPGEFRRVPNWTGPPGCTMENAHYIPVSAEKLPDFMSSWEKFAYSEFPDIMVQLALLHAEFEALHPFLDGNGRLGRMIIPLFLWQKRLIRQPMFYISAFFESHRDAYYDGLLAVSQNDDWTGWCRFFLQAVQIQAEDNLKKAQGILSLYEGLKVRVPEMTHSQYAIRALDWIFGQPIFSHSVFIASSGIPEPTAKRILSVLESGNILRILVPGRGRRSSIVAFSALLNIAEGKELV
jgi:Fic family protein